MTYLWAGVSLVNNTSYFLSSSFVSFISFWGKSKKFGKSTILFIYFLCVLFCFLTHSSYLHISSKRRKNTKVLRIYTSFIYKTLPSQVQDKFLTIPIAPERLSI